MVEVDGAVARIILNRPHQHNAVTTALAAGLRRAIADVGHRPDVRVIVLSGAGGHFCSGGDFDEVTALSARGVDALRGLFDEFGEACAAIGDVPVPVIAAVAGDAMAGGFELLQASDIVLVSVSARISDNHIRFGMIPGGGGSQRLPRLVGTQRALGHMLSGDRIDGAQAVAWGLAYEMYADDEFADRTEQFARRIASFDPVAVGRIKQLVRSGLTGPLDEGLAAETDAVVDHIIAGTGAHGAQRFAGRGGRS
ncbi:enoyl-CoA hydratase/isomerase family protein [Gordonia oryzae]|uniref:Enoyl-CoA hydratase/isomerase family protein n=1 Tax=Gordonia oryzae TaxID=2487349 RepID=A0A3N4GWJ1_9ACTN|nr:enoyl-CoA hydratase/isomerase family protein [Gordonia oryzae]RPA57354.1 enoyl-CoA hydratase/isomerase family protein [Gordonia oryzae]